MDMATASEQQGVTRSAEYTWRPPSPPHIHIPPQRDDGVLTLPARDDGVNGEDIMNNDLRIITQGNHIAKPNTDWTYEMRRKAQPILPFLYLGPSSAARDTASLEKEGITMLLVIRDTAMAQARMLSGQKVAAQLGIEAASIDVSGTQELIAAFPRAIAAINNHLLKIYKERRGIHQVTIQNGGQQQTTWGKVLVFCESGNERSACVVAAYLMHMYQTDLVGALQYIQSQRFCVAYDDNLKFLLDSYQQILEARRAVDQAPSRSQMSSQNMTTNVLFTASRTKRGREDRDDEGDMDMDPDRADDEARFSGRTMFMPFK